MMRSASGVQLSVATGNDQTGITPQGSAIGTGIGVVGQSMTGGTTSLTDTKKEQVEVLPDASVAVYTTVVSPVVNKNGGVILDVSTTPVKPQLSFTVGVGQLSNVSHFVTGRTMINGKFGQFVSTGGVASTTRIENEQVAELP